MISPGPKLLERMGGLNSYAHAVSGMESTFTDVVGVAVKKTIVKFRKRGNNP